MEHSVLLGNHVMHMVGIEMLISLRAGFSSVHLRAIALVRNKSTVVDPQVEGARRGPVGSGIKG